MESGANAHRALYQRQRGAFTVSTDPRRLDIDAVERFLRSSYWASDRSRERIERTIANSLCFGLYDHEQQVGFARVVTDYADVAWLCDVFVDERYRGRELGKWLIATVIAHPQLQGLRRWLLATRDAHGLYRMFGFKPLAEPDRWMEKRR